MSNFRGDVVSFHPRYRPLPPGYVVVRTDDHYQWLKLTPDGRDFTAESCISVDRYSVRRGAFLHAAQTARQSFLSLWESINGTKSVAADPWVWALTFKRVAQ